MNVSRMGWLIISKRSLGVPVSMEPAFLTGNPEDVGGKTVFDPSLHGFRIMSQKEAVTLRYAYYYESKSGIQTPLPGSIYDGSFLSGYTGVTKSFSPWHRRPSETHAGRYLLNSTGGPAGWAARLQYKALFTGVV